MELEDIQPFIVSRLSGYTPLSGTPIVADDGSYPKTPGREEALAVQGLVCIVWQTQIGGILDSTADSGCFYVVTVHVVLEENQEVCRTTGVNIPIEKAWRLVFQRVAGSGEGSGGGNQAFMPLDPPGSFFGKVQGINRAVVSFTKLLQMQPDLSDEVQIETALPC